MKPPAWRAFVLRKYPGARCRMAGHGAGLYRVVRTGEVALGLGDTAAEAWKRAAEFVRYQTERCC